MAAYYSASYADFARQTDSHILGELVRSDGFDTGARQKDAWVFQIESLRELLSRVVWRNSVRILFEFSIPRRGKRIDCVLLIGEAVFVLEYKVGAERFNYADRYQVEDYALDLRDFHSGSSSKRIVPILVATRAAVPIQDAKLPERGEVAGVLNASADSLEQLLSATVPSELADSASSAEWEHEPYLPTPTIIEAAQSLYAGQGVKEITRSYASEAELHETTQFVVNSVREAKRRNLKRICFVTGVPGAGKTLVGLNIVHNREEHKNTKHLGVFLSGNGPLVKVLRESLARDRASRVDEQIGVARREVSTFIQSVHVYLDAHIDQVDEPPPDNVVIFDEAQRAWDAQRAKAKFNRAASEPEQLLEIMNRHRDWAVFVALVGGGQEINSGEAGLPEWGRVLAEKFPNWEIEVSPQLLEGDVNAAIRPLFSEQPEHLEISTSGALHLDVTQRSYRAQRLNEFVEALLDNRPLDARNILDVDLGDFPLLVTRDLNDARDWLREQTRGLRRCGLVASSGARRLRPEGVDVQVDFGVENWFLEPRSDVRSSYALEIPATEFQIQGLELDWIGLCWDLDLRREQDGWGFFRFSGTKWQVARKPDRQRFQLNKYRVLLTRARQGLVIFVPRGSRTDQTRPPDRYDAIYEYLKDCGIPTADLDL